jgi:hypothetical protein
MERKNWDAGKPIMEQNMYSTEGKVIVKTSSAADFY